MVEGLKDNRLEKLVEEKVKEQTQEIRNQNQELRNELENLKSNQNQEKPSNSFREGLSRREFLKKAGLGTAGLAALMSPVSAFDIRSDDFSVQTGTGSDDLQEYFRVNQGASGGSGEVEVLNTDLIIDQDIETSEGSIIWDSSNTYIPQARLQNDSVEIIGKNLTLGGSIDIFHDDLSDISSSDHHSRYSDSEAISAVDGEISTSASSVSGLDSVVDSKLNSSDYSPEEDTHNKTTSLSEVTSDGADIYIREEGSSDPTSSDGDIVFWY